MPLRFLFSCCTSSKSSCPGTPPPTSTSQPVLPPSSNDSQNPLSEQLFFAPDSTVCCTEGMVHRSTSTSDLPPQGENQLFTACRSSIQAVIEQEDVSPPTRPLSVLRRDVSGLDLHNIAERNDGIIESDDRSWISAGSRIDGTIDSHQGQYSTFKPNFQKTTLKTNASRTTEGKNDVFDVEKILREAPRELHTKDINLRIQVTHTQREFTDKTLTNKTTIVQDDQTIVVQDQQNIPLQFEIVKEAVTDLFLSTLTPEETLEWERNKHLFSSNNKGLERPSIYNVNFEDQGIPFSEVSLPGSSSIETEEKEKIPAEPMSSTQTQLEKESFERQASLPSAPGLSEINEQFPEKNSLVESAATENPFEAEGKTVINKSGLKDTSERKLSEVDIPTTPPIQVLQSTFLEIGAYSDSSKEGHHSLDPASPTTAPIDEDAWVPMHSLTLEVQSWGSNELPVPSSPHSHSHSPLLEFEPVSPTTAEEAREAEEAVIIPIPEGSPSESKKELSTN